MTTVEEPRTSSRRIRPLVAGARITESEMQRLRQLAEQRGLSVSDTVRELIQRATA